MYAGFLLVFGVLAVVAHPQMHGMPKCGRIMHGGLECCKKELARPASKDDIDNKECFTLPKKPPPSCEIEICLAKKRGVASDDGTIDKAAATAAIEKELGSDKDLVENIKTNCINGDLSKYGPSDMCELMKVSLCTDVQMIKSCDEWNEEGDCNGMKELAADCIKQFS